MHRVHLACQFHRHTVDKKWHIVIDDFDHRMGGMPTVLFKSGIIGAYAGFPGRALLTKGPHGDRGTIQIFWFAIANIFRRDIAVIVCGEDMGRFALFLLDAVINQGMYLFQ